MEKNRDKGVDMKKTMFIGLVCFVLLLSADLYAGKGGAKKGSNKGKAGGRWLRERIIETSRMIFSKPARFFTTKTRNHKETQNLS